MKRRAFTDEENAKICELYSTLTTDEIAYRLSRSRNSIFDQTLVLGLRVRRCTSAMRAAQQARKGPQTPRVYVPSYTDKEKALMEAGYRLQSLPMMGVCRVS